MSKNLGPTTSISMNKFVFICGMTLELNGNTELINASVFGLEYTTEK